MLNKYVAVYVPSTNYNKQVSVKQFNERTEQIASKLCEMYGGATVEAVKGYYKADNGELIAENINKVIAFYEGDKKGEKLQSLLTIVKKAWQQESIAFEDNGALMFV